MIYRILYSLLHESANIRDKVGTRIWAENAPAGEPPKKDEPYLVLKNFSGSAESHMAGESDCAMPMIQIDCHDKTANLAEQLYQRVRNRVSGFRGTVDVVDDDSIPTTVAIHEIKLLRPGMTIESPQDASDRWSYNHSADFDVFHEQSVPTLL